MAISWLVALKAVPWVDLVQAAPDIVKGAKKLYTSVRSGANQPAPGAASGSAGTGATGVEARVAQLENRLAALMAEQQASAEIIRGLADQNARMIEVVGILRARARLLAALCVVTSLGCLGLAVWVLSR